MNFELFRERLGQHQSKRERRRELNYKTKFNLAQMQEKKKAVKKSNTFKKIFG